MDPTAAKYIGAGIACLGMGFAAMGVGSIFNAYLSGALRNPAAAGAQFTNTLIGAALAEGLGIFSLVVALLLLYGV
jgi:F-type H+-transporting ATPase subunit c